MLLLLLCLTTLVHLGNAIALSPAPLASLKSLSAYRSAVDQSTVVFTGVVLSHSLTPHSPTRRNTPLIPTDYNHLVPQLDPGKKTAIDLVLIETILHRDATTPTVERGEMVDGVRKSGDVVVVVSTVGGGMEARQGDGIVVYGREGGMFVWANERDGIEVVDPVEKQQTRSEL
eukprot:CAMPEP_0170740732 /NCGR_PEP_ID=MMETSP0437-20130122/5836_1 /TAXON_ID=0 /ORGANISM="Sexangularia sp." /LENGTH=172 /DNA_ID=CAMNT_0011079243 /DNA_START=57 /DNA_END=575 /DNA_ORIENTATION=+